MKNEARKAGPQSGNCWRCQAPVTYRREARAVPLEKPLVGEDARYQWIRVNVRDGEPHRCKFDNGEVLR